MVATKRAQVRSVLERLIDVELHPGDPIPSERALVDKLNVSRVTVRQAISDLVESGALERVHGKGTFVTGPQVDSQLHLTSFSREMRARGLEPGTVVPISWVAVGTPAQLLSPDRHEAIWAVQQALDFPGTVYGVDRDAGMAEIMRRQAAFYAAHDEDRIVD